MADCTNANDLLTSHVKMNELIFEQLNHTYTDIFKTVEQVTQLFQNKQKIIFNKLFNEEHWKTLTKWKNKNKSIILQFELSESSKFEKKIEKNSEVWYKNMFIKTKQPNIEYHWIITIFFKILIIQNKKEMEIKTGTMCTNVITKTMQAPINTRNYLPIRVIINDFLDIFDSNLQINEFKINLENAITPNKNIELENHLKFVHSLQNWVNKLVNILCRIINRLQIIDIDIISIKLQDLVKYYPKSVILSKNDKDLIINDYDDNINSIIDFLSKKLLREDTDIPFIQIITIFKIINENILNYHLNIDNLQSLQYKNLIQCLGREIEIEDINNVMNHHFKSFFKKEFQPINFNYFIKTTNINDSEGEISIENKKNFHSIQTFNKKVIHKKMSFNLSQCIHVSMNTRNYCHGWLQYEFSSLFGDSINRNFQLCARAKEFSCFILLLGNMLSDDKIQCNHAIIVRNNDHFIIPLLIESLPSAKAFKKAISSLSKDQQDFANAYRSMQLEGSLFVICTIPIQPQLERLLNIPFDLLTKQTELIEDIITIIQKYQIPPDLIAYNGPNDVDHTIKLNNIKENVNNMLNFINDEKKILIEKKNKEIQFKLQKQKEINNKIRLLNNSFKYMFKYACIYDFENKMVICKVESDDDSSIFDEKIRNVIYNLDVSFLNRKVIPSGVRG